MVLNWRPFGTLLRLGRLYGAQKRLQNIGANYITGKEIHSYRANRRKMAGIQPQIFDFLLVLDFEATCQKDILIKPQEVIEFPVLKVNCKTFETDAVFHTYVQPTVHTELTPFCTELTGIIQDMVDGQPTMEKVMESFEQWMQSEGLLNPDVKFIFTTCGDWDLKVMLPSQSMHFNFDYPDYMKKWINIKKPYSEIAHGYPRSLMEMIKKLNLTHQGREHSGIDDCKNVANIVKELAQRGCVFKQTGCLSTDLKS